MGDFIKALFALCFMLSSSYSAAEQYALEKREIDQLFDNYMAKYNRFINVGEYDNSIELYHDQVMLVTGSNGQSVASSEQMDKNVIGFLSRLKQQGVASVRWESSEIDLLGAQVALVKNVAIRFTEEETVFNRVGATYLVQKGESGWRIAAFSIHPPEFPPTS